MIQPLPINSIICGDSAKVLKELPPDSIDMMLWSPPYGDLRRYTKEFDANNFPLENILIRMKQVLKPGGVSVAVVGDFMMNKSKSGLPHRIPTFIIDKCLLNLHVTIIYEKNNFSYPRQNSYYETHEYIFVFSKGRPKTFFPIEDRETKNQKPWGKHSNRQWDGSLLPSERKTTTNTYSRRGTVWRYRVGGARMSSSYRRAYDQSAIFPEWLAEDQINSWSRPGEIVLDFFNGSGTTTSMAKKLGRQYIGIDISQEYCDMANDRLKTITPIIINPEDKNE
ncbi:MAG: site-specific DNA-methyltransferase [Nitrospirae bacterium]|nr:site-specific DNA-methyltransferase [Nitrospirota bacterium]